MSAVDLAQKIRAMSAAELVEYCEQHEELVAALELGVNCIGGTREDEKEFCDAANAILARIES